jgi:hypothetical protein
MRAQVRSFVVQTSHHFLKITVSVIVLREVVSRGERQFGQRKLDLVGLGLQRAQGRGGPIRVLPIPTHLQIERENSKPIAIYGEGEGIPHGIREQVKDRGGESFVEDHIKKAREKSTLFGHVLVPRVLLAWCGQVGTLQGQDGHNALGIAARCFEEAKIFSHVGVGSFLICSSDTLYRI